MLVGAGSRLSAGGALAVVVGAGGKCKGYQEQIACGSPRIPIATLAAATLAAATLAAG